MSAVQLQQGDVNIVKISPEAIPVGYKNKGPQPSNIIREGSATGHSHRLEGTCDIFISSWPRRTFAVCHSKCELVHEEHKTIELQPGAYEFIPVAEFDPVTFNVRNVVD